MKKRSITILLLLCFVLAACGRKGGEVSAQTVPTSASISSSSSETAGSAAAADLTGVRPEVKEYIDSYEAAVVGYVELMKKYKENPMSTETLKEFRERKEEFSIMSTFYDGIDKESLTAEEAAYLVEVEKRCAEKMAEIQ